MQVAEGEVNQIAQITAEFGGIKDGVLGEDTINPTTRLRAEFDYARLCFKNIPTALQDMKKMDPNGRLLSSCDHHENKIQSVVLFEHAIPILAMISFCFIPLLSH